MRYNCGWVSGRFTEQYAVYSTVAYKEAFSHKCLKTECSLYGNAWSVMMEFCVLWLAFNYIISFTLHDLPFLSASTTKLNTRRAIHCVRELVRLLTGHDAEAEEETYSALDEDDDDKMAA